MNIKVVLACRACDGSPALLPFVVSCSKMEYSFGDHYEAAIAAAEEHEYEGPFIAFDERDGPEYLFHFQSRKGVRRAVCGSGITSGGGQ